MGFLQNLFGPGFDPGIAFGAGTKTMMELDREADEKDRWNKGLALQERGVKLQEAEGERKAKEYEHTQNVRSAQKAHRERWSPIIQRISSGDMSDLPSLMERYSSNQPPYNDGMRVVYASGVGGKQVANFFDDKGNVVRSVPVDRDTALNHALQMAAMELAMTEGSDLGGYVNQQQNLGLKGREIATKEEANRINDLYRSGMLDYYNKSLEAQRQRATDGSRGFESIVNLVDENGNASPFSFNKQTGKFESLQLPSGYKFATQRAPVDPEMNRQFRAAVDPLIVERAQLSASGKKDEKIQNRLREIDLTISALRNSYGIGGTDQTGRLNLAPPPTNDSPPQSSYGLRDYLAERSGGVLAPGGGNSEIPMSAIKRFIKYGVHGRPALSPEQE